MIKTNESDLHSFAERLRSYRKAANLSQGQVIIKLQTDYNIDIVQASLSKYESGTHEPNLRTVKALAEIYGVDPQELLFPSESELPVMQHTITVYGRIPAGVPFEAIQDLLEDVEIPSWLAEKKGLFGLKVVGDSMNKVIPDGAIAVLQKTPHLENGDIGAVMVNGYDATLKKFFRLTDSVVLEPLSFNPDHEPMVIKDGTMEIQTIGKLVWFCAAQEW